MKHKLVPTVTPFTRDGQVDCEKLRFHVQKLLNDGIDYIWLCGTTGLGPSLSAQEKKIVLECLSEVSDKVIFQLASLNLNEALELAEFAKSLRVHAISSYPPFFFPRLLDEWVINYYVKLSKIYPLFVYNFPSAVGYNVSAQIIKRVNNEGGNIVGIKDTIDDLTHMLSVKWELGKEFMVYCGPDPLMLSALRSGLDGAVAGSANYAPELLNTIANDPNSYAAEEAQRKIIKLLGIARSYGQWSANYSLTRILRGYDAGEPRPPVFPLTSQQEAALAKDVFEILKRAENLEARTHNV
jgi:2-dehydro-3-deoxy-phosphogluconate/2-dehydro-3-deoxy-6-phosphogalactonate aldolase